MKRTISKSERPYRLLLCVMITSLDKGTQPFVVCDG